jgi:hypothetical protein
MPQWGSPAPHMPHSRLIAIPEEDVSPASPAPALAFADVSARTLDGTPVAFPARPRDALRLPCGP